MKKKILLRLYNPHDIDLISLMIRHQMDIIKAVYCAITAFANKESFVIRIPPLREYNLESKRVYSKHLILDLEKDKNVIQLLERIEPGYRNNFLKNILRLYLLYPATETFFINAENMELFETHYQCLSKGKRFVDAAILKKGNRHVTKEISKQIDFPIEVSDTSVAEVIPDPEPTFEVKPTYNTKQDVSHATSEETITSDLIERESIIEPVIEQMANIQIDKKQEDELTDLFTALLG